MVGNQVHDLTDAQFAQWRTGYRELVLDIGTGDGKHALHLARTRPDWLVVGLDAQPDNMRHTAGRAARKPAKGGQANVVYVWASASALPEALAGAGEVHVLMPWGSLLRGMLDPGGEILAGLAAQARPGAPLLVTLNLHAWRPPVPEVGGTDEPTPESVLSVLAPGYARAGWTLTDAHYADGAEIAALATSWSRRLGASRGQFEVLTVRGHRLDGPAG